MTTMQRIPRNADLLVRLDSAVSDAQFARIKHEFQAQFAGHRAVFFRGCDVTITPIVRRARGKYTPSLVGHRA